MAINVKHRMNFADALSEQFKTKISWLELPNLSSLGRLAEKSRRRLTFDL